MDAMNSGDFFGDLRAFIALGESARMGGYDGLYPYPFALVWAILSLIPYPILLAALIVISAGILIALFKRRAFVWLLYAPILYSFSFGQLSVIWLGLMNVGTGLSLALLTLKPQVFVIALPVLADRWPQVRRSFLAWCAVLYLPSFLIRPTWPAEWLQLTTGDGRGTSGMSASVWSASPALAIVLAIALFILLIMRWPLARHAWQVITTMFNPAVLVHDYTMLAGASLWLIPASWLVLALVLATRQGWPFAVLGLVVALNANEGAAIRWRMRARLVDRRGTA